MTAFVECPACQRKLVPRPGNVGRFKSSCPYEGCGAALLCDVVKDELSVQGPRALHEAEKLDELQVRASTTARSFWAPSAGIIILLGAGCIYILPFAFAAFGAGGGLLALFGLLAFAALILVLFWIKNRVSIRAHEPLREIEGALERWTEPGGYRG